MKNQWVSFRKSRLVVAISVLAAMCLIIPAAFGQEAALGKRNGPKLKAYTTTRPASAADASRIQREVAATGKSSLSSLPLFTYDVTSSRDGNSYSGVIDRRKSQPPGSKSHSNTTFATQIYIRWCCIDLSNAPRFIGT